MRSADPVLALSDRQRCAAHSGRNLLTKLLRANQEVDYAALRTFFTHPDAAQVRSLVHPH